MKVIIETGHSSQYYLWITVLHLLTGFQKSYPVPIYLQGTINSIVSHHFKHTDTPHISVG